MSKKWVSLILIAVMTASGFYSDYARVAFAEEETNSATTAIETFEENLSLFEAAAQSNGFLAAIDAPDPDAVVIHTAQELSDIRNNLSGSYVLANDIDLAEWDEWTPIGDSYASQFTGTFDGQGHVIHNLKITESSYRYNGLFGYADSATIQNVGLEDTYIDVSTSSSAYAGGICGASSGVSISNCYNTGVVSVSAAAAAASSYAASASVGGICASGSSSISNCYNTSDVSSSSSSAAHAGGICASGSSSVSNCYNTGNVSASSSAYSPSFSSNAYAGGIYGSSFGSISNCYNLGDVSASSSASDPPYAGGICGFSFSGSISNCYNLGDVSASSSASYSSFPSAYAGGICGYGFNGKSGDVLGSISNCVVLSNSINARNHFLICYMSGNVTTKTNNLALAGISGNAIDDADRRISLAEAKSQSTYQNLGWDFDTIWEMAPGYTYPQLKGLPATEPSTPTPTPPQGVPLSGKIKSYNLKTPATIQLLQNNAEVYATSIPAADESGQLEQGFLFEGVAPGTYTLLITKPAHASYTVNNIVVTDQSIDLTQSGQAQIQLMTLLTGDIDGDGFINVSDLNTVWSRSNYNKPAASVNPLCDLNGDGAINVTDLNIVWSRANYNKSAVAVEYNN